jgi:DNA polymerase-3 subunit epsilon
MRRFLALDFETADQGPDSACSIGLVRVEEGKVVAEAMKLIRPPRPDMVFTYIHGLTWDQVKDSPAFGGVWPEIAHLFEGVDFAVAHNAPFDRKVLQACCAAHGIEMPKLPFQCSVQIARRAFGIYPTKLSNVCQVLGIPLNHHEALSDARACAQIVMRAMEKESGGEILF